MKKGDIIPQEIIEGKILFIQGKKVMLDRDLAILYGVETRTLNQAVKRNMKRFPEDFMFQLTAGEMKIWKSQIVISNKEKMGLRRKPYAKVLVELIGIEPTTCRYDRSPCPTGRRRG